MKDNEFTIPLRSISHREKDTIVSNKNIVHLTSKFEYLTGILENGFRSNIIEEYPVQYQNYKEINDLFDVFNFDKAVINKVKIPMVCFSDIPRKAIKMHMAQYGFYGLSISKDWAISNFISPVFYIKENTSTHILLGNIFGTLRFLKDLSREELIKCSSLITNLRELECYIKLYQDNNNYKYYDEREWRYIPNANFDVNKPETYLKLDYNKIQNIFVKTTKERKRVIEILKIKSPNFDLRKIKFSRK